MRYGVKRIEIGAMLRLLVVLASVAYLLIFLLVAVLRLGYPYPLELMEGVSLQQVERILDGQPLYVAPALDYVPSIYPPLYFYLAGLVARVTGDGFLPLRLVSLLASVGTLSFVFLLVRRETRNTWAAIVAAGLLAGTYRMAFSALDLARVDALAVFLIVASVYCARVSDTLEGRSRYAWAAASGALGGLSIATKQTSAVVAAALGLYLASTSRARLAVYGTTLVALLSVMVLALRYQSGDWVWLYLVELPQHHALKDDGLIHFWIVDLLPRFTFPLLVGPVFLVASAIRGERRSLLFWGVVAAGALVLGAGARANPSSSANVLLPAFAVLSILFGLGLHEVLRALSKLQDSTEGRSYSTYVFALCLLQLAVVFYNPRLAVPYRSDGWAAQRLVDTIASLNGRVLAPELGAYLVSAGKPEQAYSVTAAELLGGYGDSYPEGGRWLNELNSSLQAGDFDYVLVDPIGSWPFITETVEANGWVRAGPLFKPGDSFFLWTSGWTPVPDVYVRSPSG